MKTEINSLKSIVKIAVYRDYFTSYIQQKERCFSFIKTTNACGYTFNFKIPFICVHIDVYIK